MAHYDSVANVQVFEILVTDTHSSGKTTDVDGFRDPDLSRNLGIPQGFGISLQTAEFLDSDTTRPFVVFTLSEAAMQYASQKSDITLLGSKYSMDTQRDIEFLAAFKQEQAKLELTKATLQLKDAHSSLYIPDLANFAFTLADRGPNDGEVYSKLRVPDDNRDDEHGIPVRDWWRGNTALTLDHTFIADPSNVPFEPGEQRSSDSLLRQNIHEGLIDQYRSISHNPLTLLSGTTAERHEAIRQNMLMTVNQPYVARGMITGIIEKYS